MQLAEVMRRADLTEKAVRVYENEGLISPARGPNGRRIY
ncbi:MAG: MerR family DNA-binding transcriptional regulator, partial [Alphaproteobacteria bacterium]